jgi:hypothetical protein
MTGAGVPVCERPVFVVGSPRSGTTALPLALARHSALWTSHESYVLHQLYGNGRATDVWRRNAERRSAPSWLKTEEVSREEFLRFLGLGINALYTSRSGGRRWIDQTPLNTLMLDDLALMFPGAQFIHILRDGRDVVHSMSHFLRKFENRPAARTYVPAWASDFGEACRTWRRWVEAASSFCGRHPERAVTVINAALAADPAAGFAAIHRFLGVEDEPGPARFFAEERPNSSFGSGRPEGNGFWDADRRVAFAQEAGPLMLSLGLAGRDELRAWLAGDEG